MGQAHTTDVTTANCSRCKKPFSAKVMLFDIAGRETRLQVSLCADCEVELERNYQDRLLADRLRAEERQRISREIAWSKLCPAEFRLRSESDGETDIARLEREQPRVKDLLQWRLGRRGLLIRGVTGLSKTRATWRLMRRLWIEGVSISAMTAAEFDRQCRDAGGNFTLTEWFNRLATVQVFFLDDLGKGNWTAATEAQWFDLVDTRCREHRPIIVTTNDDGESLSARMSSNRGEALIRRLRDYCDCIVFGNTGD
jgi:DNA replication protein DnaC